MGSGIDKIVITTTTTTKPKKKKKKKRITNDLPEDTSVPLCVL